MISRDEIINQSEQLAVHPSHVQRDYIFGWLLSGIYSKNDLANALVLKGGNCFRKAYFEKARYSPDLDFYVSANLADDYIKSQLNLVCQYVSEKTGVEFVTSRTRVDTKRTVDQDRTIQKVRLYFKDFFGNESELVLAVRLDLSQLEKMFLPVQSRPLIHQYSDSEQAQSSIKCVKLEELLASKLKCLLQRRHSADLYDFVNSTLVHPKVPIDRNELVRAFLKMTIFESGPRIVLDLLVNLPFQIIKGLWEKYLIFPNDARIDYDNAVSGFSNIIEELFGALPLGSSQFSFFPSELRNPIMQAGYDLTVLKINYQGYERLVEPYSLKYKRRKDGIAREYLYVYDQTGGRSSGPGIKAFVHQGINSIENTNIKFEPREEVELSKAGQLFGDTHFKGSRKQRLWSYGAKQKYVVVCPVCGKRFYRDSFNTRLNRHKGKNGFQCFGTIGIPEW